AKKRGIFVSVDPKERDFPFYKDVGLITPNTKELGYGAGMPIESDNDVSEAVEKIRKMLNPDMVLVTRGSQGMSLFEKDALTHIPTAARKVFDVTGAGDTVIACFTLCMAAGATPQEATLISNAAAGMVVAELGAASAPWEGLKSICMEATHG
ncbi:MAG: PfkB family carbohydrate kinase, partial [Thermodesulfobacteriota bacterium]|nr:PfkB family carbohydrate kinase [Thermodesulfobacteriota bacterium]